MARFTVRNDATQMEARPIGNGATRFLVQGPDGVVYDITGAITDFEVRVEREAMGLEFGGRYLAAGPTQSTMTFTVSCTQPIRRHGANHAPPSLHGVTADLYYADEVAQAATQASDVYNSGGYLAPPARPAVDANEFRHEYQNNPEEPGICAVSDCGMWPEHHDHIRLHARQRACVCSGCMPDSNDLPDDQHFVDARSSATTMHPGATSARSHP